VDFLLRNPEFIRRARAELRPSRMAVAGSVVVILCLLLILIFYHPGDYPGRSTSPEDTRFDVFAILISAQALILGLRCLTSCSQAVASERVLKTFDFLRTTRLSSWELMIGMVFGAPLMGYFSAACAVPFTLYFGLTAGISLVAIVITYAMMLLVAIVLSLAALTMSMKNDKPRAGEIFLLVLLLGWPAMAVLFGASSDSRFPGLTAITVVMGLLPLYHPNAVNQFANPALQHNVPFFWMPVSPLLVSVILYASAGAWLALMIVRNLKKDPEDIRLLSRWQAVGFAAYVNVLVFALLDLRHPVPYAPNIAPANAADIAAGYLGLNFLILYAVGIATLTPLARLKTWWRKASGNARSILSDDGPPWPWMAASAGVALLLFVLEAAASTSYIRFSDWPLTSLAGRLFIVLVFATRDILFLQWCVTRNFKRPVAAGMLYLSLYYFAASIVAGFLYKPAFVWFTPVGAFGNAEFAIPTHMIAGIVLQIGACLFLLIAIREHLAPPAPASVPSASGN
jgi:hypothetical protein